MAYLLGEAAVRITANASGLHKDIEKELAKERGRHELEFDIKTNLDKRKLNQQFDAIKKQLNRVNKDVVDIAVYVHTQEAERRIAELREEIGSLSREVRIGAELDYQTVMKASDEIDDLRSEQEGEPITIPVHVDTAMARLELAELRASEHLRPLIIPVKFDMAKIQMPKMPSMSMQGMNASALDWTPFLMRNLTVFNLLPEAVSHLNRQFEQGIELIYGDYITAVQKVYSKLRGLGAIFRKEALGPAKNMSDAMLGVYMRSYQAVEGVKSGLVKIRNLSIKAFKALPGYLQKGLIGAGKILAKTGVVLWNSAKAIGTGLKMMAVGFKDLLVFSFGAVYNWVAKTRIGQFIGRQFTRAFRGIVRASKATWAFMMRHTEGFRRWIGPKLRFVAGEAKKAFMFMGRVGKRAFTALMNNNRFFTWINKSFTRMGRIASGVGRTAIGAFVKMAGVLMGALMPAIMAVGAGLLALGGQAILGAILAVAGALGAVLHGALLIAPALIGVAAVSFAALKIGLKGVGEGVKAAFSAESAAEFEKAIAKLPPQAQNIARAFRAFKGPMDEMKRNVQENMLGGLAPMITNAMNALFPRFKAGLEGIASMWNGSFKNALAALSSAEAKRGVSEIMKGAVEMAAEMRPMLGNIIKATGSLAEQGAKHLKGLGSAFNGMSEKFFNYAESLRKIDPVTGLSRFDLIMEAAKTNAKYLADIFGGLGGTLISLLKAGATGGGGMLAGMATAMQELNRNTKEGTEGFKKIQEFMATSGEAASQLKEALAPIGSIAGTIFIALANVASGAIPGIVTALQGLRDGLTPIKDISKEFGDNMGIALGALGEPLKRLGEATAPLISGVGEGLAALFQTAEPFLNNFMTVLGDITKALEPVWKDVGKGFGDVLVALNPIITSVGHMITGVVPVLRVAFDYIAKVAVELINLFAPLFVGRDAIFTKLFQSLEPLVHVIGQGLLSAISALKPVIDPIVGFLQMIIQMVIDNMPVITMWVQQAFKQVVDSINLVVPIIAVMIEWLRRLIEHLGPIITVAITALVGLFQIAWPIINAIFRTAIRVVIIPLLNFLGQTFNVLMGVFRFLVVGVFSPMWDLLKQIFQKGSDFIVFIIEKGIRPTLEGLKNAFGLVVDGISFIWNGLKKILAEPIKFFIETIVNEGIVGGWNKVSGLVGNKLGTLEPIKIPGGLAFKTGGVLPGYTPGRDVHQFYSPTGGRLHLSGGEAIMRPEWTQAVGGPGAVEQMNRDARAGRLKKRPYDGKGEKNAHHHAHHHANGGVVNIMPVQALADGGILQGELTTNIQRAMWNSIRRAFPGAIMTSGTRYADVGSGYDFHMAGQAIDLAGPMQQMANWIASEYPDSLELFWDPGPNIDEGRPHHAIGGHSDHVHWAMDRIIDPYTGDVVTAEGGSRGGGGGMFSMMWNKVKDGFNKIIEPLKKEMEGRFPDVPGQWSRIAPTMANKAITGVIDWVKEKVMSLFPGGGGGGVSGVDMDSLTGSNREMGRQAAEQVGWADHWESLDALIMGESGWNHLAKNPTSTAYGLFQFLDTTWATVGAVQTDDPKEQIDAGFKYISNRYGDPTKAYQFWLSQNPHWYDSGGVASGKGMMMKNVIRPERVLSPSQTKAFNDFVYKFMPKLIDSYRRDPRKALNIFGDIGKELRRIKAEDHKQRVEKLTGSVRKGFEKKTMGNMMKDIVGDPWAYLEAEEKAKEAMAKELEKQKEKELKDLEKAEKAEDEKIKEKRKAEDKAEADAKKKAEKAEKDKKKADDKDKDSKADDKKEDDRDKADASDALMDAAADTSDAAADTSDAAMELRGAAKDSSEDTTVAANLTAGAAEETRSAAVEIKESAKDAAKDTKDSAKDTKDSAKESKASTKESKEKDKKKAAREAEDEAKKEARKKKRKAIEDKYDREAKKREKDQFWYGFKVFGSDGSNPNKHEATPEEEFARRLADSLASLVGMGDITSPIMEKVDFAIEAGSAIQTALPAWIALSRGDARGFNHNVAAAQATYMTEMQKSWSEYLPNAIPGMIGSAVSAGNVSSIQPFIGTVNSGMTQAELMQTLDTYEKRRARKIGGTVRTR